MAGTLWTKRKERRGVINGYKWLKPKKGDIVTPTEKQIRGRSDQTTWNTLSLSTISSHHVLRCVALRCVGYWLSLSLLTQPELRDWWVF